MPFTFEKLAIPEVVLIKPRIFNDNRGYFMETYKKSDFEAHGIIGDFCQDNYSFSSAIVQRGLHYQLNPKAQGKLVKVLSGAVFDVAVDIRKGSPTFGQWVSATLSAENHHMLWVPEGFAHGILTLQNEARLAYRATNEFSPTHDRQIAWNDPHINIQWPLANHEIILSDKDKQAPPLKEAEINFTYS